MANDSLEALDELSLRILDLLCGWCQPKYNAQWYSMIQVCSLMSAGVFRREAASFASIIRYLAALRRSNIFTLDE